MALKVIQVGMGGWGRNWAKNVVPNVKGVELVAYVDLVAANLKLTQTEVGVPAEKTFLTVEEAIAGTDADAVLITTFLEGHIPVTLAALEAGKHVLVEKPFAPTVEEAAKAIETARRKKRVLMVSQNYRFNPAPIEVRKMIEKKTLGKVGAVYVDFRRYANTAPVAGHKHYAIWHPLLVDMSIHHFDLMRMVLGQEPRRIECRTWNPSWSRFKTASSGAATIDFDNGAVVSYRGSWVSTDAQTNWSGEWRIECEKGVIEWTSRGDTPDSVTIRPSGRQPKAVALPRVAHLDREGCLDAFANAVARGKQPDTSGQDNIKTLELMFAAVSAADTGAPVELGKKKK